MAKSIDERWVLPSPETMAEHVIQIALECFPVIVEQLLAMPREPLLLAEGFEFLPESVATVLSTRRQAIWLVPTQAFQEASFQRREKASYHQNKSDPARAAQNHRLRDWLLARYVKEQALARDLKILEIDGTLGIEEVTKAVEAHFEPLLRKAKLLND
jgi:hypothetical protein